MNLINSAGLYTSISRLGLLCPATVQFARGNPRRNTWVNLYDATEVKIIDNICTVHKVWKYTHSQIHKFRLKIECVRMVTKLIVTFDDFIWYMILTSYRFDQSSRP